jgi:hypothetical protein
VPWEAIGRHRDCLLRTKSNLILARNGATRHAWSIGHLLDRWEIGMTSGSAIYGGAIAPADRAHAPNE